MKYPDNVNGDLIMRMSAEVGFSAYGKAKLMDHANFFNDQYERYFESLCIKSGSISLEL